MKQTTCPICQGKKTVEGMKTMCFSIGPAEGMAPMTIQQSAIQLENNNYCPCCGGSGVVAAPPFGDGSKARITKEKRSELASAGTLMRNIDSPEFVQVVAAEAARIILPDTVVETFVDYWDDPARNVTLGEYIEQIAEYAEQYAIEQYGDTGNKMFMAPRPNKEPTPQVELNDGHFHEALHTTHVIRDMFYSHVVECAAVDLTPELKEAAEGVANKLNDLYQQIGAFDHNRTEKKENE